jgi:hypothetical protein
MLARTVLRVRRSLYGEIEVWRRKHKGDKLQRIYEFSDICSINLSDTFGNRFSVEFVILSVMQGI